jgi:hypothetical protein
VRRSYSLPSSSRPAFAALLSNIFTVWSSESGPSVKYRLSTKENYQMITKLLVSAAIVIGAAVGAAPLALADPVNQYGTANCTCGPATNFVGGQTLSPQEVTAMLQAAQSALKALPPQPSQ